MKKDKEIYSNCTKNILIKYKKDDQGIKDSEFIKAKGVKNSASKGLTFKDFDKCVHDITNAPITHTTKNKL